MRPAPVSYFSNSGSGTGLRRPVPNMTEHCQYWVEGCSAALPRNDSLRHPPANMEGGSKKTLPCKGVGDAPGSGAGWRTRVPEDTVGAMAAAHTETTPRQDGVGHEPTQKATSHTETYHETMQCRITMYYNM